MPRPTIYLQRLYQNYKLFKREIYLKTYHAGAYQNYDYNPRIYIPSTWMEQWWQILNETPRQIKEFEAVTKPLFQKKFGGHKLLPHHFCAICWVRSQENFLIVKFDKNLESAIIERGIYIESFCRDHLYQRDTYLYLPPVIASSKMVALKMKVGAYIKQHAKQLTRMEKCFITTNLQANVDPFLWFCGMIKIHKTLWTMRPIISCTVGLMHPIGVWTGSKFQQVVASMPGY